MTRMIDWERGSSTILERCEFELCVTVEPFREGDTLVSYAERRIAELNENWKITGVSGVASRIDTSSAEQTMSVFGAEWVLVRAERLRRLVAP